MWKFQDLSITHILREIKFGDSESAKSAISTLSEALNFDIYEFLHFLKSEIYQIDKVHSPKTEKRQFLALLVSLQKCSDFT